MSLNFYTKVPSTAELPHPAISLAVFLVVENGIRATWDLMRNKPRNGFDLLRADEDTVTHELYERLYDEVFGKNIVDGFDRELLTAVSRESKLRTYNGGSLDKMPDLLFGLADRLGGRRIGFLLSVSLWILTILLRPITVERELFDSYEVNMLGQ